MHHEVESAHRAWESGWRDLTPGKRSDILFNVSRVLRENLEEIAQLETLHIGKPISDARDEAALGAREIAHLSLARLLLRLRTWPRLL